MLGYPAPLYRALGHPVTWMGAGLAALERRLNRPAWSFGRRRAAGVLALALLLGATALVTVPLQVWLGHALPGVLLLALLAASLPAQRSLHDHVRAVAIALERDGVEAGRRAVGMIVGRDTAVLDRAGVARAAIESLAENFSDGIVAPAVWLALGGLPGCALYKAANTADSMVGHRSERYAAFGWAAARFDDVVNLPASRLAALWIVIAAALSEIVRGWRRAGGPPRRVPSSLAQRGLARSRDGGRAGAATRRTARLRRRAGRGRLHGGRATRGRRARHPPRVAALSHGLRGAVRRADNSGPDDLVSEARRSRMSRGVSP